MFGRIEGLDLLVGWLESSVLPMMEKKEEGVEWSQRLVE
jgi:hypothetical protein